MSSILDGRKSLKVEPKRRLSISVKPEQRRIITDAAKRENLSINKFLLQAALRDAPMGTVS